MTTEYQITIEPLGREVTCREDQTVLDVCEEQGVPIPRLCHLEGQVCHVSCSVLLALLSQLQY